MYSLYTSPLGDIARSHGLSYHFYADDTQLYTAISRKVVDKNVHATFPRGSMGYVQYAVPDTVAVEPTFVAFL